MAGRYRALLVDPLAMHRLHAEGSAVFVHRRRQILDGDADVIDLGEEGPGRIRPRHARSGFRRRRPAAGAGCNRRIRSIASGKW